MPGVPKRHAQPATGAFCRERERLRRGDVGTGLTEWLGRRSAPGRTLSLLITCMAEGAPARSCCMSSASSRWSQAYSPASTPLA